MTPLRKAITLSLWALAVLSMVLVLSMTLWGPRPRPAPLHADASLPAYRVPEFSFTDQAGQPFGTQQLAGHVWIASFIFTRCQGPCPMMTRKFASLQREITDPSIRLVTFSIDPEHDTPQVLREYARQHDADESRWRLLTGPVEQIHKTAAAMNIGIQPATDTTPILHSTYFVLVDASGQIRGYYSGQDEDRGKALAADAQQLAKQ